MPDKKLEDMLTQIKNDVMPGRFFALKMRFRLQLKSWSLFWKRQLAKTSDYFQVHRFKFAGVVSLILMTLTGSVGAYAYTNPNVNVMHPLYPLKQGIENAELYFAGTPQKKAQVNLKHALKRMQEAEILADRLIPAIDSSDEEKGVNETLLKIQDNLDLSLNSAADEDNAIEADETLNKMHYEFKSVHERLDKLEKKDNLKNRPLTKMHFNKVKDFTETKLINVTKVSDEVKSVAKEDSENTELHQRLKSSLKKLKSQSEQQESR